MRKINRLKKAWCALLPVLLLCACGPRQEAAGAQDVKEISVALDWIGSEPLAYAGQFAIDYYEGGYTLLSIADGSFFLVVPEGEEAPGDLPEEITVLYQPVDNLYLAASAVMDMICSLEALEHIRLSGTAQDGWYIAEAAQAMAQGDILYAGKYSAPDYELILSEDCGLAVENTMIFHTPEVKEKLESLGVPVLVDYSSYEEHPLGRVEWIKLYGALLGEKDKADSCFQEQSAFLQEIAESVDGEKTVVFFYMTTDGAVNVRKSNDYIPKMIELAGGTYLFEEMGDQDNRSTSETIQFETFYQAAREADYLIYNSSIDGGVVSVEQLLEKNALFGDFKAVQEGNVWCTTKNFYQESMSIGSFIGDLHSMLAGTGETAYLYRVE